jgi:hypothetical protein
MPHQCCCILHWGGRLLCGVALMQFEQLRDVRDMYGSSLAWEYEIVLLCSIMMVSETALSHLLATCLVRRGVLHQS